MKRSKLILRTLFILGILSVYVVPLLSILFNINFRNIIGVDWPEFVLCMPFGASAYGVIILSAFMEQEQTAFIVFIIGILIPLMALIGCLMIDKSKWVYRLTVFPALIFAVLLSSLVIYSFLEVFILGLVYIFVAVLIE